MNSAVIFFTNTLQVQFLLTEETKMSAEEKKEMKAIQDERRRIAKEGKKDGEAAGSDASQVPQSA